ncbi:hypothetical protein SBA5_590015 [Candidatus Sulfotelmatomonas gaucii]|uniref:Uncharacterized protein n=1 Tax=Candidatus Sulfuritelmatomonas gaucii TaxID=2043161 RepID=A0A2N9LVP9_9BACT|nr:hypothetical protein SBA5_590015 [Candidatus Sulfotelmatomonas gaucii]
MKIFQSHLEEILHGKVNINQLQSSLHNTILFAVSTKLSIRGRRIVHGDTSIGDDESGLRSFLARGFPCTV